MQGKLMPYYNPETRIPAVIPDRETEIFIFQKVRITGGLFEGAEGYIKRIKGNRRLVVRIEGVVAVATSYIPSCFVEKL